MSEAEPSKNSEQTNTQNLWMDIVSGAKPDNIDDMFTSDKVMEALSSISNFIQNERGASEEEAKGIAVNILAGHALRQQREVSPSGHKALISNLAIAHPDLDAFRSSLKQGVYGKMVTLCVKIFIAAFLLGSIAGAAIAYFLF